MVSVSHNCYIEFEKGDTLEIVADPNPGHPWLFVSFSVDLLYYELDVYRKPTNNLIEPRNNDGRSNCYWCGGKTKNVSSINEVYQIFSICGK
ncbi:MAG: hypothetical protein WC516_04535 [Patescibacteria group bacterium]|jgi:hypothetical protein